MPDTSHSKKSGNFIERFIRRLDKLQQNHRLLAFPYAIIKKYGDDEAGYQGALITYYGFLSLFPLLIVGTSVIGIVTRGNDQLRLRLLSSIDNYFPSLGGDLQTSVHGSGKTGLALVLGLLVTFYGVKGVADAVRHALNHIWEVPRRKRAGFPKGVLKSFMLIIGGSLGFLAAAVLSSYATSTFGHSFYFRLMSIAISFVMLLVVFLFVYRVGSSAGRALFDFLPGAVAAAVGLLILHISGGYLITHHLHDLNGAYGRFGLVLAILFWIYLQAQVFLYAAELNTVKVMKLWPRSLAPPPLLPADHAALRAYASREAYHDSSTESADTHPAP